MTRLPLTFAPLIEMAERAAIEHSAAFAAACTHEGAASWDSIGEHSRRVRAVAFAALLSDLTRPESQALWLRWLADRVGVPVPPVGAPGWAPDPLLAGAFLLWCRAVCVAFTFGLTPEPHEFAESFFAEIDTRLIRCPALDNPDSADAPIRALVLAILTVGGA